MSFDQSLQSYADRLPLAGAVSLAGCKNQIDLLDRLADLMAFDVHKKPLFFESGDLVPKAAGIVGNGEFFGVVSEGYQIVQNGEIFNLADQIIGAGGAPISGGRAGNRFYLVFAFSEFAFSRDEYLNLLTLTWGHGGDYAVNLSPVMLRMYCRNQFPSVLAGEKTRGFLKVTHYNNAAEKLAVAGDLAIKMNNLPLHQFREFSKLAGKKFKQTDLQALAKLAGASDKQSESILEYWDHDLGRVSSDLSGTAYHALNTLTAWASNAKGSDHSKLAGARAAFVSRAAGYLSGYQPTDEAFPTFDIDITP